MDTITFLCSVITPMALAGANKNLPEFRAPSLKGGLRFWWRALNSKYSLEELRSREARIFGSSDEAFGRSKFDVSIKEVDNYKPVAANLLPHKSPGAKVKAIPVETEFKVMFNVDRGRDVITKSWVRDLFILFSILGGLGKRVRRGFGSFEVLEIDGKSFDKEVNMEFVYELIRKVASFPELYKIDKNRISITEVNKSAKYPFLKKVEIGSNCVSDYDALLKRIGQASHKYNSWGTGSPSYKDKRLASPIYVSVINGKHDSFCPIISTLNPVYPKGVEDPIDKSKEFKEALL